MSLAINGGVPVRTEILPYAQQYLTREDIEAVTSVLDSAYLTTGPMVREFEDAVASYTTAKYAVALSSGTAALHAAMHALNIGPGDEVIVPAISFVASANVILYQGATPIFADVDPDTLLINPIDLKGKITERTRAIIAVDYAGQPCDYEALKEIALYHNLAIVADASHSLGSVYKGLKTGAIADITTFSFHPVKNITSGEGGMITTDDEGIAESIRQFRNHGISQDHLQRSEKGTWFYDMAALGFNYRITDIQCALGLSQLGRLDQWIDRRNTIAQSYNESIGSHPAIIPLRDAKNIAHARHLYIIKLNTDVLTVNRDAVFSALRAEGIGVNVHYMPIYRHSFYNKKFGEQHSLCPFSEMVYQQILTLPLFPAMSEKDEADVVMAVNKVIDHYSTTC